jgi:hypothetical protein
VLCRVGGLLSVSTRSGHRRGAVVQRESEWAEAKAK